MKKFAVIDVGSNSVRLLFVADGKVLYKDLETTRLGEGLAQTALLQTEPVERTARAVERFYLQAQAEGAEETFAFATAAVRAASNRDLFLDRVKTLCGLSVEVISGEEEAEIGLRGALGNADGGVIDIGGASTEIVVKKEGKIVYKKSVDMGVVRLKDRCGRDFAKMQALATETAKSFEGAPSASFYGIGGTATTLGARRIKLEKYQFDAVTGVVITQAEAQSLADELSKMTVGEIAALPCMPAGRADVITGGAILLATLMKELSIPQITVSDRDNLEGYAIKKNLL